MSWHVPLQTSVQTQRADLGSTASDLTLTRTTNYLLVIKFRTRNTQVTLPLGHSGSGEEKGNSGVALESAQRVEARSARQGARPAVGG
ncbi:hypothetical protein AVEN_200276-1 [Araneus ventricosus]|uniref:Uncharacterized protein n=1 Tax=Araneus ventricosus TaxID=182803 RepID=A0A4Y2NZI2_ARAVE|nr:hypothetical protein AVEN_200276-1 [Araneus ventricosus]